MTTENLGRYTVLCHDGLGHGALVPEEPSPANTADTITAARDLFARWLRATGNDHYRDGGYGAPYADVVPTSGWDGVSYGDTTGGDGVCRLNVGPRGGIRRSEF